ncbi:hypothetical protein KKB43_01795 [Patescibacteria group bacterium]|nr:hypothetical protein [Patescibacteria group bacterium]MBU4579727.1 hypothetical protein [Patescibacteria group bacterium]
MIKFIKEFLKPNLGKIILTVGFGLAAYYFGINACITPSFLSGINLVLCHYVVYSPVFWGPAFLLPSYATNDISLGLSAERIIFGIIYWYLIASVIMYFYSILKNEFTRKNHSEN